MFGTSRFTHFAAARFIFSLKLSRSAMGVPRLRPEERQRMQRHGYDPRLFTGETDKFFNKVGLFISLHTLHIFTYCHLSFQSKKVTPCIRDAIALAELINICNVCVYVCISMYHVCISITISRCSARRSWQSAQRVLGSKAYGGSRLRVMGSSQRRRLRGYCQQHLIHPLIMSPLYQWQYELLMVITMGT